MILDSRLEFASKVSVAAAAGTALIGNVVDLVLARDIGSGKAMWLVINVDTEIITGGGAGTIQFKLSSDAQAAIATDGSATDHFASRAFVTGNAASNDAVLNVGGMPVAVSLPLEGQIYERYLGILAITATTTTTAGKINAFLTFDQPATLKTYADAVN